MAGVNNTDGEDEPTDGEDEPTDGEDEPTDGEDEPTDGEDEPTDGEDEPTNGEDEPTDGEDGEDDPEGDETDEKAPDFNLVLVGGKSKEGDLERKLLSAAKEADEKEQQSLRLRECKNVIKWAKGRLKYNSLFKLNTNTARAKDLIDTLRTEAEGRPLTFEDLDKVLAAEGSPLPTTIHQAFLEAVANDLGPLGSSVEASSETATQIRETALNYVTAISSTGLSAEQRAEIHTRYSAEISGILATANGAEAHELRVYADNASEILTTLSASALHQEGLANVEAMIQDMEIRVGEGRIGANNHEDISYLRKVDKLGQKYNVGSAIGKASFVASTWIATGVASGLAVRGAKQTVTMTAGVIIGSAFAPGIGTLVGIGVSAVAAGAWGRYMGRRRASEQGSMASTNVERENGFNLSRRGKREIQPYLNEAGDYRSDLSPDELAYAEGVVEREKVSSTLEKLKPEQMPMAEGISFFMRFMQPVTGLERDESGDPIGWNPNDISNYELKPDLTPDDAYLLAQHYAKVKTIMDFEDDYNQRSEQIANLDAGRNVLTKTLKSSKDTAGFALNLFSASTNESYLSEKVTLAMLVQNIGRTVETDAFKNQAISSVDDSSEPYGTRTITFGEVMNLTGEQAQVECEANVSKWQTNVNNYINKTGRRAGLISGSVALAAGLASAVGMAYVTEKATGGQAQTVLDILNPKKYNVQPKPRSVTVTDQGGNVVFDDGVNKFNVPKNPDGSIDPSHISTLKQAGIEVTQTSQTTDITVPVGESLKLDGGAVKNVADMLWADNKTKIPDFSELGLDLKLDSNTGAIIIDQFDLGGRTSHVVADEITQGNVLLRFVERIGDGKEVVLLAGPAQSVNGKGRWVIEASDALYKYFTINNGKVTPAVHSVGSTLKRFGEPLTSIATELGKSGGSITETITTYTTEAVSKLADTAGKLIAFVTGLHAPGTKSVRGDTMKKPGGPNGQEPRPEQPIPEPEQPVEEQPEPQPEPVGEQTTPPEPQPEPVGEQTTPPEPQPELNPTPTSSPTQQQPVQEEPVNNQPVRVPLPEPINGTENESEDVPEWAKQLYRETEAAMREEEKQANLRRNLITGSNTTTTSTNQPLTHDIDVMINDEFVNSDQPEKTGVTIAESMMEDARKKRLEEEAKRATQSYPSDFDSIYRNFQDNN